MLSFEIAKYYLDFEDEQVFGLEWIYYNRKNN